MTYLTEFPDFPAADLPAIPAGFEDTSWHNNSAPSFANRTVGLSIWVDFADVKLREYDGGKRFIVHPIDAEGAFTSDDAILETDDWSEVLAFIIGEKFADVLKHWLTYASFVEMKRLNETAHYADGCCASHNYCDANTAMEPGFTEVMGHTIDGDNEADCAIWNKAWEFARKRHIGTYVA